MSIVDYPVIVANLFKYMTYDDMDIFRSVMKNPFIQTDEFWTFLIKEEFGEPMIDNPRYEYYMRKIDPQYVIDKIKEEYDISYNEYIEQLSNKYSPADIYFDIMAHIHFMKNRETFAINMKHLHAFLYKELKIQFNFNQLKNEIVNYKWIYYEKFTYMNEILQLLRVGTNREWVFYFHIELPYVIISLISGLDKFIDKHNLIITGQREGNIIAVYTNDPNKLFFKNISP